MNSRRCFLFGLFAALGLIYVALFTEWLRPAPIEIASQVRQSILPLRFNRPVRQPDPPGQQPSKQSTPAEIAPKKPVQIKGSNQVQRVKFPAWGAIEQAPGGVANVTFSLDAMYALTALRVEDVPANGAPPKVFWQLTGKSQPTRALLYGRTPEGMKPATAATNAEPLIAGAPYRLIVQAGRRRGTNYFTTAPVAAAE